MNPLPDSDVSLYELALGSTQAPSPLQVSPATFKSSLGSLLKLLTEQKIPAMLWAKLPHGAAWQVELKEYCTSTGLPQAVYLLQTFKDELAEETSLPSMVDSPGVASGETSRNVLEEPPEAMTATAAQSPVTSIQLAPESQLKREYFLLVWSTQFCGLILAHRPRSLQPRFDAASTLKSTSSTEMGQEESPERKHPLLALYAFDQPTIERVLTGIRQAISFSWARGAATDAVPSLDDLLNHWDNLPETSQPGFPLLGSLFTRQLQRQEEISHRASIYRKQAETVEILSLQNQELLSSIRFKDEFLNNVGQELRTPLTNMKTALTLLNSPNLKPPQRQRYMDLLSKECDRQSSLITSLLELVRLDQVVDQTTFQPLRLTDVVPGVVSTYQPLAEEKGIRLAYTVPDDLPTVSCMHDWLKQIVINLLHNGIKFTPRGGQVWVRAKQQGDYVQLEFRDNGIGIAPSEISKVFDRFYRVRQSASEESGGVGLGLTIVQQLLLHCGGSISVKSKLGEGSAFNVLLPVYRSSERTSTSDP